MDPKIKALKEQIKRLLENKSSRREAEVFLQLSPEVLDSYLSEEEWDGMVPGGLPEEWPALWLKQINRHKEIKVRKIHYRYWLSAAAVLLLVASMAIFYTGWQGSRDEIGKAGVAKATPIQNRKVLTNQSGVVETYTLPDHSVVKLSPGSTLRFADPMEPSKRSLSLDGEAVFHVRRDPHRPFTVYSNGLATTALGTVFKVTSYKKGKVAQVQLISGKISVQDQKEPARVLYLTAGQQCRFDLASQKLEMMRSQQYQLEPETVLPKPEPVVKTADAISFNNVSLPEVLQQISILYNTPIVFPPAQLMKRKFTGRFKREERLADVMETLVLLNDLQIKKGMDTIYARLK